MSTSDTEPLAQPRKQPAGPSPYQIVADQEKYRVPDAAFGPCQHGASGTLCSTSGKVGRNGRSAAIGATLCWLTCPQLNNIVARFERNGLMPALAARFTTDSALVAAHVSSHGAYESLVMRSLDETQRNFFKSHFIEPEDVSKRKFGNAAVGHEADLKCMHALVAQTICGASNPLGNLCLHYILHLKSELDAMVNAEVEAAEPDVSAPACASTVDTTTPTTVAASPNLKACGVVDRPDGMLQYLDRVGLAYVMTPPMASSDDETESGGGVASAECCAAAAWIIVTCEGHAPRTRKKHRKN